MLLGSPRSRLPVGSSAGGCRTSDISPVTGLVTTDGVKAFARLLPAIPPMRPGTALLEAVTTISLVNASAAALAAASLTPGAKALPIPRRASPTIGTLPTALPIASPTGVPLSSPAVPAVIAPLLSASPTVLPVMRPAAVEPRPARAALPTQPTPGMKDMARGNPTFTSAPIRPPGRVSASPNSSDPGVKLPSSSPRYSFQPYFWAFAPSIRSRIPSAVVARPMTFFPLASVRT